MLHWRVARAIFLDIRKSEGGCPVAADFAWAGIFVWPVELLENADGRRPVQAKLERGVSGSNILRSCHPLLGPPALLPVRARGGGLADAGG